MVGLKIVTRFIIKAHLSPHVDLKILNLVVHQCLKLKIYYVTSFGECKSN